MKASKIKVLIVDDHEVVRQGLKALLEAHDDIEVVGVASNGQEALRKVKTLKPHVIILDIAMPVMHGIQAAENLAENSSDAKILILSSYSEPQEVARALEAGAAGFVMKETASSEIAAAVRAIHKGNAYFTPEISKRLAQQTRHSFLRGGDASASRVHLTERELQVLKLISEGKANKQIGDALQISIKTVEKHRGSLMEKLDIHEAATLTKFAVASGVISSKRPALAEAEAV